MKIGLFLGSVGSNSGGPERYESELVKHLAQIDKKNEYQLLCLFKDGPRRLVQQSNFKTERLGPSVRAVSMLTSLPYKMRRYDMDVWHATYLGPPFTSKDYIYSLVCSSMIEHPELYPPAVRYRLVTLTNRAIAKAGLILCISDHIRQVVRERYGVSEDRLAVSYLGVSETFQPMDAGLCQDFVRTTYGIDRPYFLFSGRWEPRKNIVRIIEAFAQFKNEIESDIQMVFTGERTWAAEEAEKIIQDNKLQNDVIDLGKSPVGELPQLYAGALALVYPSLWEGFGLPIVEGMAAGIPVITSNNSSMAEIGAEAALLVEPTSVESIAEAMHNIASDEALRVSMRTRGLERAKKFSWKKTAEETLALYEQFANSHKKSC